MLEVRAVLVGVPRQLGQRLRPELAGVVREADDREVVARVLGADERVERDRDLLRREIAVAQEHRAAHVDEQHGRRRGRALGAVDLEVVGAEPDGGPGGAPARRVLLAQQRVPSVARRSRWNGSPNSNGLRRLLALAAVAGAGEPVAAERVAVQPREQLVEDLLADPPVAARGELQPVAVALEVARLLEPVGEVLERVEVAGRVRAQQVAHVRAIDLAEVARAARAVELRLELVERLEPAELVERRLEAQRLVAVEPDPLAQPAGEQLVEVRGQLGEVPPQPVVAQQRIERVLELLRAARATASA